MCLAALVAPTADVIAIGCAVRGILADELAGPSDPAHVFVVVASVGFPARVAAATMVPVTVDCPVSWIIARETCG
jgi:hypothetical protein